jgi:hypothetical protein
MKAIQTPVELPVVPAAVTFITFLSTIARRGEFIAKGLYNLLI